MKRIKSILSMKSIFMIAKTNHFQFIIIGIVFSLMVSMFLFFAFDVNESVNTGDSNFNRTLELIIYDFQAYDADQLLNDVSVLPYVEAVHYGDLINDETSLIIVMKDYKMRYETIESMPVYIKRIGIVTHKIETAITPLKFIITCGILLSLTLMMISILMLIKITNRMLLDNARAMNLVKFLGYNQRHIFLIWIKCFLVSYVCVFVSFLLINPILVDALFNPILSDIGLFERFDIKMGHSMLSTFSSVVVFIMLNATLMFIQAPIHNRFSRLTSRVS